MYQEMQQKKKQNSEQMKGYKYVFSKRKNKCLQIKFLNHLNRQNTDRLSKPCIVTKQK